MIRDHPGAACSRRRKPANHGLRAALRDENQHRATASDPRTVGSHSAIARKSKTKAMGCP